MNKTKQCHRYELKPDAQGVDEIHITTVPRYKTSGLSGNEWRISALCKVYRKGELVDEFGMRDVKNCVQALPSKLMEMGDEGKFFFGGGEKGKCDQEGCKEKATELFRMKKKHCREHPSKHFEILDKENVVRGFCKKHSTRGDSDYNDQDSNYELIDSVYKEDEKQVDPNFLLIQDIKDLLLGAEDKEFTDFENDKYDSPKVELILKLQNIINNTKDGKYDN